MVNFPIYIPKESKEAKSRYAAARALFAFLKIKTRTKTLFIFAK